MRRLAFAGALALAQLLASPAAAQVETVAAAQIPAGNALGPQTPSGFMVFPGTPGVWFGDEAFGLRHYKPIPLAPQYQFDIDQSWSVGGNGLCIPFCSVGQVAMRSPYQAIVASWDHTKGQPGQIGGGGVYVLPLSSVTVLGNTGSPVGDWQMLAPTKGLAGNQPTSVAYGPDGKVYVGFLKSPSYVRITGIDLDQQFQTVESVGTALNGKPIYGMAFYGSDLYLVTGDGLYVVPNVLACNGNTGNCGAPKLVWNCAGPCNAIAADGKGNLYFAQNAGGAIFRYTPASPGIQPIAIASGFRFAAGHTNGLGFDAAGNLWIGDMPAPDGTPNGGRLSRIPAASLPN